MPDDDVTRDMPADLPLPEPLPIPPKSRGRIGTTIGGYEVEGELGRGGMGVVYRARQATLNRQVALKMLTGHYGDNELQRFLAEAQTAAALHHTNIVHIYEVGEVDGAPFFAMEYVEGGTLADQLRKGLPPPRAAAQLLATVARALHFAHQHGVVHRDMKPANIMLDPDGVPKVADFGIAKRMGDDHSMTRSGAIIGTPTYMAPEQARGTSRDVGPVADVYALGAILYEMLTGRPPFLPEESETAITVRVLTEETPSPAWHRPEIPREIEIICMKCLQKDPRDRYASAAALAEDLRRFLDDEGILARPPSRLVKTFKWVRRNPWEFTVTAALIALAVVGGQRLYQWEFYQRPHLEYAATVDYVNGALEPAVRLEKAQAARRAMSLQLTRQGRRGPVVKIEVLNPRGHPAAIRRLQMEEAIPLYMESLAGTQPLAEKTPESTVVEQLYEGRTVREITGRDRDGSVNWRILYDRPITSAGVAATARARFANLRGIETGSRKGATLMEFERDAAGRDVRVTFFNSGGKPAANGEGVYGYQLDRDPGGRLVRLTNLDRNGQPAANREGLIGCSLAWGPAGRVTKIEMLDADGKPALWNGLAALATDYDDAGNAIRVRRLGPDGQTARRGANDWAVQEIPRNERGEITARKYLRLADDGQLTPLSEFTYAYDDNGQPTELGFSGATKWRTKLRHEADGNLTEERFLDGDGHPITGEKGYSIRRIARRQSPQGLHTEDTYFDLTDSPAYNTGGYRRLLNEYDANGSLRRQIHEEHDPKRFSFYRLVAGSEYDLQGRLERSTKRYEDQQGALVADAGLGYSAEEEEYDETSREIVTWQSGWSVGQFGAPVWRKDTDWYSSGVMRRRVWQAYDEKRQPLKTLPINDPARTEEEFSAVGKIERKLETGFDETRLGYESREIRVANGQLESVIHRRADGSVLKDVRVMIKEIFANAQPKTAELRVGDQFLTANGEPVANAFAWMFTTNFPGGALEVLRYGERLRIEGFAAGKLGVALEDRGPDVP